MISLLARSFTPRLFSSIHPRNPSSAAKQCAGGARLQASSSFVHMCKSFATFEMCCWKKKKKKSERKRGVLQWVSDWWQVFTAACVEDSWKDQFPCVYPDCVLFPRRLRRYPEEPGLQRWFILVCWWSVVVPVSAALALSRASGERRTDWWASYRRWD